MGGYDYAGNDPVTRDDPSGLRPADCGPDGCLQGYQQGVVAGQQASQGGTKPASPQAARAIAQTAAYENTQNEIAKLKAQIAALQQQYKDQLESCYMAGSENKRIVPADTSSCGNQPVRRHVLFRLLVKQCAASSGKRNWAAALPRWARSE
jgi:hypothetical protein